MKERCMALDVINQNQFDSYVHFEKEKKKKIFEQN